MTSVPTVLSAPACLRIALVADGIAVAMLLCGTHARALLPTLAALSFAAEVASPELGVASAITMCRSVIVKSMEALVLESFVAAR